MVHRQIKAYEDIDFLKSDVCRPVRLQLELLKPDVVMSEHNIRSTIVLFGSARTRAPEAAAARLTDAEAALELEPDSAQRQQDVRIAKRMVADSRYYEVARNFAKLVSSRCQIQERCEYVVVTGGGGGIMEAGNRGASDVGAKSIGLNISLPFEQKANPYIPSELCFNFHYFSIRKMHFLLRAKAMCAFPGGFGTMDELFETLTLIQTGKIRRIPVILFGREFWEGLVNWDALVERGLVSPEDLDIFTYCETAEQAWDVIEQFWRGENGMIWAGSGSHPTADS